jgi:hypothetical protein
MTMQFPKFPKVPRYSRECVITEKIDGTNASIHNVPKALVELDEWPTDKVISSFGSGDNKIYMFAGSRKRFITPDNDNFGFAKWVQQYAEELIALNAGSHYGEWWGSGIQRGYGLDHKRFSLFNVNRWVDVHDGYHCKDVGEKFTNGMVVAPECCHVVPVLAKGNMDEPNGIHLAMDLLKMQGSHAAPGYMNPEGIMIYHSQANMLFKKTFEHDEKGKWEK